MNFLYLRRALGTGRAFKEELERNSMVLDAGETYHGEIPWWISG